MFDQILFKINKKIIVLQAENGGVIMLNFYSQLLSCKDTATVQDAVGETRVKKQ